MERRYKGVNREALLQLTKEELIDLLIRADEYAYDYEGFRPLEDILEDTPEEKYLLYEEVEEEQRGTGSGGIRMETFQEALKEVYEQVIRDTYGKDSITYQQLYGQKK